MSEQPAKLAEGLKQHYRKATALDGGDHAVPAGTALGRRGPIGAGQTTGEATTALLTTHHLEAPARLAATIAVIDHGRVIAEGTADELKKKAGGDVLELTVTSPRKVTTAVKALREVGCEEPSVERRT